MLRAPLPAATSRNRIPGRSPARRRPSFPSHICDGVFVRSYPAAIASHATRVVCACASWWSWSFSFVVARGELGEALPAQVVERLVAARSTARATTTRSSGRRRPRAARTRPRSGVAERRAILGEVALVASPSGQAALDAGVLDQPVRLDPRQGQLELRRATRAASWSAARRPRVRVGSVRLRCDVHQVSASTAASTRGSVMNVIALPGARTRTSPCVLGSSASQAGPRRGYAAGRPRIACIDQLRRSAAWSFLTTPLRRGRGRTRTRSPRCVTRRRAWRRCSAGGERPCAR